MSISYKPTHFFSIIDGLCLSAGSCGHWDTCPSTASASITAGSVSLDLPSGEGRFACRIFISRLRAIARVLQSTRRITRSTCYLASRAYRFFSRAAIRRLILRSLRALCSFSCTRAHSCWAHLDVARYRILLAP